MSAPRTRASVGVIRERGVDIRDGHHTRLKAQILGGEAEGITAAIESLVMLAGDACHCAEVRDAAEDLFREQGMALHHRPLSGVELVWLVENGVGNTQLAQIVEQRGAVEELNALLIQPQLASDAGGGPGDSNRMSVGIGRFGVDDLGKGFADGIDAFGGEHCASLRSLRLKAHDAVPQVD
jgi:hypothetical protein